MVEGGGRGGGRGGGGGAGLGFEVFAWLQVKLPRRT